MTPRTALLLLASAILLTPQPSVSESPDFLAPSTCAVTSSSPDLPLFNGAESARFPFNRPRCGACGACEGLYQGDVCGVASNGQYMYCSDKTEICTQDGLYKCVCEVWLQ